MVNGVTLIAQSVSELKVRQRDSQKQFYTITITNLDYV